MKISISVFLLLSSINAIAQNGSITLTPKGVRNENVNLQIGQDSFRFNTTGSSNIALGALALEFNTEGSSNIAAGLFALQQNTTGTENVAIGVNALQYNRTKSGNIAIGADALKNANSSVITGFSDNIAIGKSALRGSNTTSANTGVSNIAIGRNALIANTSGSSNIALGLQALFVNTDGTNNVAIGNSALEGNTGNNNTAVGVSAATFNSTGSDNTALGRAALYSIGPKSGNTAIGSRAMYYYKGNNTASSTNNTAIGYNALLGGATIANNTGINNTAVGANALKENTAANFNVAIGTDALADQSFANGGTAFDAYNVAVGAYALRHNQPNSTTTGIKNTAVGGRALENNQGQDNVAVGYEAGYLNTSGYQNTFIGRSANGYDGLINTIAIGYNATVNAHNKAVIGNASMTTVGGYGTWSNYSDQRLKENIVYTDRLGLEFIMKLKTASYNYTADNNKRRRDGLIAQDVQAVLDELNLPFSGLIVDDDPKKTLNLAYADFVLPLINAIQTQQAQITQLKAENAMHKEELSTLKNTVSASSELLKTGIITENKLHYKYSIPMKSIFTLILCACTLLTQAQRLVKDLNTGPKGSNPKEFTFGTAGYTYFIATSYASYSNGNSYQSPSIWYSYQGGTPSKINGTEGVSELVLLGSTLYFITDGQDYGASLNKLTYATGGVEFIEWIFPQSGFEYDAHDLVASGDKMYFFSNNSLWVSEGTEASTIALSNAVNAPQELTTVFYSGSNTYGVVFSAENSSGDRELYVSNGNTVTRIDINIGSSSSAPRNFSNIPTLGVLFSAFNGGNGGHELFRYDGTQVTLVKNINPNGGSDPKVYNYTTTGFYYVAATTANEGRELWKTDGTSAGTVLVEDINPGTTSSDPEIIIMRGNRLFFAATHPNSGRELWMSEGAASNTLLYQNIGLDFFFNFNWYINSGNPKLLAESNFGSPPSFYIYAQPTLIATNLYNITSTSQTLDFNFVKSVGVASEAMQIGSNNTILFSGRDAQNGWELWKSDGTGNGTALLKNIYEEPVGSYPKIQDAVSLNGNLIFSADNGTNGRELFKSDGTAANTLLLKDCYLGEYGSSPKELTKIGNYVYFSALGGPAPDWWGGYELWRTDGTANGTVFIKDVNQSHISSEPRNFKGYNNEVYFVATTAGGLDYIYKTNGTVGNTSTVTTVPIAKEDYAIVNGILIFIKNNTALSKQEVWQKNLSTGTESLKFLHQLVVCKRQYSIRAAVISFFQQTEIFIHMTAQP